MKKGIQMPLSFIIFLIILIVIFSIFLIWNLTGAETYQNISQAIECELLRNTSRGQISGCWVNP